jgi:O-antigen ligase
MLDRNAYDRLASLLLVYALIGVAIFLPWRTYTTNFCVVSAGILWFLNIRSNRAHFSRQVIFFILLLCSIYVVEVIGMIHTDNTRYGLHRLESKLSIVVLPLAVLASRVNRRDTENILLALTVSTVFACLISMGNALMRIHAKGQAIEALFTDNEYSNVALTEVLNKLHPTFLTLFICISIYFITDFVRRSKSRYWLLLVVLFLLFFAFQLASRAGYAALVCTLVLIGFLFIGSGRKIMLGIYSFIILAVFILSLTQIPTVKKRVVDAFLEADIHKEEANSVSYHFKTWTCSVETWLNGHVWFGYGTGDEVNTITQCYHEKRWLGYGHDAHNEFLSSLVKHGLFGLIVLSISFFYPFFLAVKYRDLRYFTFLTIIFICFLSESMLRGQTGLVFFMLFNTLFLKSMLIEQKIFHDNEVGYATSVR